MRIIAGIRKGMLIKTIEGESTRPTRDMVREALFSILTNEINNSKFLDLFAGSGGIGIEALSRGANGAVFVDNNKKAVDIINSNLAFTKLADKALVINSDANMAIGVCERQNKKFDIVFMDPPYNKEYEKQVLKRIANSSIISEDTLIIVEASLETNFSYVTELGMNIRKEKLYKTNKHVFLELSQNTER